MPNLRCCPNILFGELREATKNLSTVGVPATF
jgi:hypothetical protein